ncbi:MAG: dicarboxylate--CoA ligase PimA [Tistrella sp.]|uniref:Dicarboxylate--CoA ligase PimA n=1 Tax=Tistrella mobilis TaxID=171437 RepID=A0A3B9IUD8_9PROT|nr:long-chain fatty acid--CoA ligase [Tistrella sp.]MAD39109.1 dicarboxylate--CoA ligase PimA [Tistrella sp.]MBA74660.1 dicarboxylate--CoA ligase PimA [Tistrella sp.]HAE50967.1 dicarboxylate--CoA ligase PimA [Tistrella mobilis]
MTQMMGAGIDPGGAEPVWLRKYPADVNWRKTISPAPLTSLMDHAVKTFADRPAVDFLGKILTFAEIGRMVGQAAKGLQQIGVKPGDRVGLFLPNTPYSIVYYYAALTIGATIVNFNPLYALREIEHQVNDSGTRVMVTLDLAVVYDKVHELLGKTCLERIIVCPMAGVLPFPKNLLFPLVKGKEIGKVEKSARIVQHKALMQNDGRYAPVQIDPETAVAVLQYTGGTTGLPKGAMLTHANLHANARQLEAWFPDARPGQERTMVVLPLFHVFAMTVCMNYSVLAGACMIMLPRFELDQVLETLAKKKPSLFPGVPTMYTAIAHHPKIREFDLSSINYCLSGGAPLPLEVKQTFEKLTGCTLVEGYGLTETSPVTHCNPFNGISKEGSIGLPMPGTTIEIVDLEDGETVLPQGSRGEICIRGPQVMAGYWNKPEETAKTMAGGRLHTGDVGYLDEDGYAFIVDRIKDLIIAGGYNVYPRMVEEAVYLHDLVEECTVIGIPDEYRGQTVKAFVKLKAGAHLTAAELTAFLKERLSPIEMPKQIEFRDALPKTLIGKLSKKELVQEEKEKYEARRKAAG